MMRTVSRTVLPLLLLMSLSRSAFGDSLSIGAWSTGDSLTATALNSRHTTIQNWANGNITNTNIGSSAAIVGSKLDLTTGTGRVVNSGGTVTSDSPALSVSQTFNNAATAFSLIRGNATCTNCASTSRLLDLQVGGTVIASISRSGQFNLNPQNYASGPTTLLEGAFFNVASATMTDNITAASGTAPRFMAYAFQRPAVAAGNSSVTVSDAATVFIASAPVAGDNATLTRRYALWVDQGNVRVGGTIFASGSVMIDNRLETKGVLWVQGTADFDGAAIFNGNVTLGNAAGDNITVTGTVTSNLLFTDNTYDIGASGATRPRHIYQSGNLVVGGTTTLTGAVISNLIFTDNTYDIGASGATRPRHLYLSGDATIGDQLIVSGTGPHAIGGAADANVSLLLRGTFAGTEGLNAQMRLQPDPSESATVLRVEGTMDKAGSGTHVDFIGTRFTAPIVTANAGSVLNNAITVKIDGAPTGATNNYALWSAAGDWRIQGLAGFAAGDKYLVIDANGFLHVSALGPAS